MTHHTLRHRLKMSFIKNRNWKKILVHEGVEYGILGLFVWGYGLPGLFAGLVVAFTIHMFFFEIIDKAHDRLKRKHG